MTINFKIKTRPTFALPTGALSFAKPASRPSDQPGAGTLSRRELQHIVAAMLG